MWTTERRAHVPEHLDAHHFLDVPTLRALNPRTRSS